MATDAIALDSVDFVTADHHFGHVRIGELAQRPFASVTEMDVEMVARWNAVVGPDDVVLHLGDVALGDLEASLALTATLNGRRFLVPGNHDRASPARQSKKAIERFLPLYEAAGWTVLPEIVTGTRHCHALLVSHYPYRFGPPEPGRRTPHAPLFGGLQLLHGHTHARDHGAHGPDGLQFHVGVDAHGFAPVPMMVIDSWLDHLAAAGSIGDPGTQP